MTSMGIPDLAPTSVHTSYIIYDQWLGPLSHFCFTSVSDPCTIVMIQLQSCIV